MLQTHESHAGERRKFFPNFYFCESACKKGEIANAKRERKNRLAVFSTSDVPRAHFVAGNSGLCRKTFIRKVNLVFTSLRHVGEEIGPVDEFSADGFRDSHFSCLY